jgi:hypothetical protein
MNPAMLAKRIGKILCTREELFNGTEKLHLNFTLSNISPVIAKKIAEEIDAVFASNAKALREKYYSVVEQNNVIDLEKDVPCEI